MYVIWRKRKREHYAGWGQLGDVRLTPTIVESRRVDGKPKQEHVACLRSIMECDIGKKSAQVSFWDEVEEQLARLTNRIPPEQMDKIRAGLGKVVSKPDPKLAEEQRAAATARLESWRTALGGAGDWARESNKKIATFRDSLKTAEHCADCGKPLEAVYRQRRSFGRGLMGGSRWTTGALCKACARGGPLGFQRPRPCETCEREVFISYSIPNLRTFCSTRCAQTHYRETRKLATS